MDKSDTHNSEEESVRNRQQGIPLQQKEAELSRLASEQNRQKFFDEILPHLDSLKSYIARRLRAESLNLEIRWPLVSAGDILDSVILDAYQNYAHKPPNLSLEEWLYRLADKKLRNYVSEQKRKEKRRKSAEDLQGSELRTLEEMPITADVEGAPWLPEELDDSEFRPREIAVPAGRDNPETELERKEELRRIFEAMCRLPEAERQVFDLVMIQGFSHSSAAKILGLPADEIPKVVEQAKVRLRELIAERSRSDTNVRARAR